MRPSSNASLIETVRAGSSKPRKVRRNPRACDACSRRSVRCQPAVDDPSSCQQCADFGERCVFNRPARKRGKPRGSASSPLISTLPRTPRHLGINQDSSEWAPTLAITQALVMDLTELFFEVVYPVFPVFHRASLLRSVSRGEHLESRPLYASVMAMCALSSARARDGATLRQGLDNSKLESPSSEELFEAAAQAIPNDVVANHSFGFMRACMLLSITAIQYGSPSRMRYHLSRYNSYVAVGLLHDEANWPQGLSVVELEERRRLFWSAYTLDVFTSIVWGGVLNSREASSNVCYPSEIDDEDLEPNASMTEAATVSWLRGWNYVTDMYRILEYAASDLQRSRTAVLRTPAIQALEDFGSLSQSTVLDPITAMYRDLPDIFKVTPQPTLNFRKDLCSFQAANITATVQLVRMVYFRSVNSNVEQKCRVASEVLSAFADMPVAYLRAISSPLLHHLAEIGKIFGAAFGSEMSVSLYHSVRSVLLDLATFLADLEKELWCPTDASKKVESQVMRIDRFILEQRQPVHEPSGIAPEADRRHERDALDFNALPVAGTDFDEQSPSIVLPAELLEDWNMAFSFD